MPRYRCTRVLLAAGPLLACTVAPALAEQRTGLSSYEETADGKIVADGVVFDSWADYVTSDFFQERGLRCGTDFSQLVIDPRGVPNDCGYNNTDPTSEYDPSVRRYRIPVVVHVIQNSSGTGYISESRVQSQIEVLNEDFLALTGTPGAGGTDIQIEFYLATTDPFGNPTNGITYSTNDTWFNDGGSYYNTLAWDPHNYLNIYTNQASGALGYVPFLPQSGSVGSNADRVVCYYRAFGRFSGYPPYHMGRTATHEIGHYLGLFHAFQSGCQSATPPGCYTNGDRICDTNPEQSPIFGCPGSSNTCSTPDPFHNYMDYTNDTCMTNFTPEQARRERCTLEHWRPNLWELAVSFDPNSYTDFLDCYEGPRNRPAPTPPFTLEDCLNTFDAQSDGDVDLFDFGDFSVNYTGS
ncbi:MAG: zinc metalloprotease [bacterium]|nr:zinc metalloprotease [bacterium]